VELGVVEQRYQAGTVIRIHPIRHDPVRELGAFANSKGRPWREQHDRLNDYVACLPELIRRAGTGT
jgi:hypothetical protein